MEFGSDNSVGASAPILAAIAAANGGAAASYGADSYSTQAGERLSEIFERDCAVFLVATGTGANALALGSLVRPWAGIFCHAEAHVLDSECGAPEFFTGGAKLIGIAGAGGKITPDALSAALAGFPANSVHQVRPSAVSLSQATECGTVYRCDEIAGVTEVARRAGMRVHMDGARFANALVSLGCTPAEMTWKAGVDVLSFGATKNGALACEAVVFFDPKLAGDFLLQRKRGGHTVSKGRFLGAQMVAYLAQDHWVDLAQHANARARDLSGGLAAIGGIRIMWPTDANEIFAVLPRAVHHALTQAGAHYYEWPSAEAGRDAVLVRFVCSFATDPGDVARLVEIAREAAR